MIYIISVIVFIIGIVVFTLVAQSHKNEEDYYDRFYFIVSSHERLGDYLNIRNRINHLKDTIKKRLVLTLDKHMSGSEYHRLLFQACIYTSEEAAWYYCKVFLWGIITAIITALAVYFSIFSWIAIPVVLICFYISSKLLLEKRRRDEVRKFRTNFVYFLDLSTTCIKAGMTLSSSLDAITPTLYRFSTMLGYNIELFSRNIKYNNIDYACDKFYEEVHIDEVKDFVSTVKNSAQYGASMHASFRELSEEIRKFHYIETEEKIGAVNAKMGIPLILCIMFPIIVEIIAPGLLRVMQNFSLSTLG